MPSKEWLERNREKQRNNQREWYKRNKKKAHSWIRNRQRKLTEWLLEYKSSLSCERCGENHIACLDFHHRNPEEKDIAIAHAINTEGWGKKRILEEISKCEILCSNCHRKEHWQLKQAGVAERN